MSEVKKLTEEEIKKVTDIRKNYVTIQNTFGQLHLTKLNLENQLSQINVNYETLTTEYTKTQEAERTLVQSIQNGFGQLHLTKINLEKQLKNIDVNYETLTSEYQKTQEAEQEIVKTIQDKYGIGTLNIEDGTFTPTNTEKS